MSVRLFSCPRTVPSACPGTRDQGTSGAGVGFAAADGVLHWHYRQAGLLAEGERPSPRFIWMANKEGYTGAVG